MDQRKRDQKFNEKFDWRSFFPTQSRQSVPSQSENPIWQPSSTPLQQWLTPGVNQGYTTTIPLYADSSLKVSEGSWKIVVSPYETIEVVTQTNTIKDLVSPYERKAKQYFKDIATIPFGQVYDKKIKKKPSEEYQGLLLYSTKLKSVIQTQNPDYFNKSIQYFGDIQGYFAVYRDPSFYREYLKWSEEEFQKPSLTTYLKRELRSNIENILDNLIIDQNLQELSDLQRQFEDQIIEFGGPDLCYTNEAKTSQFVLLLLKYVIKKINGGKKQPSMVYIDVEEKLKVINRTPDFQIMRKNTNEEVEGKGNTPIYVIEVKKAQDQKDWRSEVPQHFEQLRYNCIQYQIPHCYGVFTNFYKIIFTRYDLAAEIKPNVSQQPILEAHIPFKLLRKTPYANNRFEIDKFVLSEVVRVFENLLNYSSGACE